IRDAPGPGSLDRGIGRTTDRSGRRGPLDARVARGSPAWGMAGRRAADGGWPSRTCGRTRRRPDGPPPRHRLATRSQPWRTRSRPILSARTRSEAMTQTTVAPRDTSARAQREEAALRRLAAVMRAEAEELPPDCWVRRRLESDVAVGGWGDLVLPELARLVQEGEPDPDRWTRRQERSPLADDEEAVLRRLSVLMRAEAAELGA